MISTARVQVRDRRRKAQQIIARPPPPSGTNVATATDVLNKRTRSAAANTATTPSACRRTCRSSPSPSSPSAPAPASTLQTARPPNAWMCQWTLLVDAEKQESGTHRPHERAPLFIGRYHVGLYCIADSASPCSTTQSAASDAQGNGREAEAARGRRRNHGAATLTAVAASSVRSPRAADRRCRRRCRHCPQLPTAPNLSRSSTRASSRRRSPRASDPRRAQSLRESPRNGGYKGGGIMSLVDPG